MNWETISGICAVVGICYLVYQFNFLPRKENHEAKLALATKFGTSQQLIKNLIAELKIYVEGHGESELFSDGLTIGGYIRYLEDMERAELSDNMYDKINGTDLNKDMIVAMSDSLSQQILSFNKSMAYFQTRFKYR
ncbi:hypothetical protein G7074_25875 [Pedobacter sp. HDW13]|uniref:hypothetical protein n=1 Tax=Pedobacter sp. HDW13 TaxID=2714940 RepID=UPI001407C3B2|nr:hypothetical protein [Pedobacter sp. HDW13]QIL42388.1 hypothetical protein G7074_25875 [Pedobacter sp. HDW13]